MFPRRLSLSAPPNVRATIILAATLAVAGCTSPPYRPVRMPHVGAEVPPEVDYWRGQLPGAEGLTLFEQGWRPSRPARAVIVFVHGLKDHSSRYRDLGIQLAHRGVALYAMDLRGHGYSEGVRDHIESLDNVVADLDALIGRVRDRQKNVPMFLAGQGFGATLVGVYVSRKKPSLAGVVLGSPMLRGDVQRSERLGTRVAAIFGSRTHKLELDLGDWSSDPDAVKVIKNDPLVYDGQPTASTARELLRASDEIGTGATAITAPLLTLQGAADRVASVELTRGLHERIGSTSKKIQIYEGLWHDLFHERQRDQVVTDLFSWLNEQLMAAAAPKKGAWRRGIRATPRATDFASSHPVEPQNSASGPRLQRVLR